MSIDSDFFSKRRSVLAKKMSPDPINEEDLNFILQAGIRVPDHGALSPWKLKVIQGEALKRIDEEVILSEFIKNKPESEKSTQDIESKRLQRASSYCCSLNPSRSSKYTIMGNAAINRRCMYEFIIFSPIHGLCSSMVDRMVCL